jgi:hypothetical protein
MKAKCLTIHRLVPTDAIDRDTIVEQLGNGQVYQAEKIIIEWILILNDESKVRGLPDTGQVAIDRKDGELHVSLLAQDLRPKRYPPVELVERLSDFCGITNPSHILLLSYILRQDDTGAIEEELRARELMARDLVSDPPSEQIDVESDLSRLRLGESTEEHAADKPNHLPRDGPRESNTHGANGIHVDTEVQSESVGGSAGDNPRPSGDIVGESTKSDSQGDTTHHEAKSTTLTKRSGKLKSVDEHRPVNEDQSDSNIVDVGDTLPTKRQTPGPRSSNFSADAPRDAFYDQGILKQTNIPSAAGASPLNIYNTSHEVSDPELVQKINEAAPTISGAAIDSETRAKAPSVPQKLTSTTTKPTKPTEVDYGNITTSYLPVTQAPQDESSETQSTSRGHERRFTSGGRRTRNASTEALLPAANLNHNEFLNSFELTSTRTFHSMRDGLVPLPTPLASFGGGDDKQTQYIGERYVGIFTSALRFARR